jgi:NhaP-type Na+/H+ or K+/H+ antiporter
MQTPTEELFGNIIVYAVGIFLGLLLGMALGWSSRDKEIRQLEQAAIERGYAQFLPRETNQPSETVFTWNTKQPTQK